MADGLWAGSWDRKTSPTKYQTFRGWRIQHLPPAWSWAWSPALQEQKDRHLDASHKETQILLLSVSVKSQCTNLNTSVNGRKFSNTRLFHCHRVFVSCIKKKVWRLKLFLSLIVTISFFSLVVFLKIVCFVLFLNFVFCSSFYSRKPKKKSPQLFQTIYKNIVTLLLLIELGTFSLFSQML